MDIGFELTALGKLLLAVVLGGIIGFERELRDRPAGLRTHMLVGGAATLLVVLARHLVTTFVPQEVVSHDPVRVMEAVIVGISVLASGTIFRSRRSEGPVQGLTTAASLLFTAVLGIGVALGTFVLVIAATLLVLGINVVLRRFEERLT
jgi:putative Mg2+ transporter-C (MgtC) family protein